MIWNIPSHEELKKHDFSDLINKPLPRKPVYRTVKRLADIVLSFVGIILLSPILLIIGLLIRFDSKGRALFVHERIGKDGKNFLMFKFRTMRHNTNEQEASPTSPGDERVTKFGRFLRRTSLDELPQLFNILTGEMSLVGPRPEMPFIVKDYNKLEQVRLLVKPGLTGLWQLAGRKDLPLHKNVEFDLYYIQHQSLLLDLIIFLKTFRVVFSGKGAY